MGLASHLGTCLWLLLAGQLGGLLAHREHKVHNIVLYPDKESWCKTTPIKQVVTWPSCLPQELDNNVCVGACFSYMVPHSEPSAPGDLIRPYCDSCQPLDSVWHTVSLQCRDKDGRASSLQKKVQIITNCSCSSCSEAERIKPDLNSLLASLEAHAPAPKPSLAAEPRQDAPIDAGDAPQAENARRLHSELPDLLLDPNLNASRPQPAPATRAAARQPNARLLRFFEQLDGPGWPSAGELADLGALDDLEHLDKLAGEEAGAKELLAKLSELLHKYRQTTQQQTVVPSQDQASRQIKQEGATEEEEEGDKQREEAKPQQEASATSQPLQQAEQATAAPLSSSSAPPSPLPELPPLPEDEDDEEVPSLQDQQLRVAASLLHRTGPHHSLVLDAAAGIKEKIDVDSHYLQPALAGQEISYHDNLLLDKASKKDF